MRRGLSGCTRPVTSRRLTFTGALGLALSRLASGKYGVSLGQGSLGIDDLNLECTPEIESQLPLAAHCCAAQRAWADALSFGGCYNVRGVGQAGGDTIQDICREAEILCRECNNYKHPTMLANATAMGTLPQMFCVPPAPPRRSCNASVISDSIVFVVGIALLITTSCWFIIFHLRLLPALLKSGETSWSGITAPEPPNTPAPQFNQHVALPLDVSSPSLREGTGNLREAAVADGDMIHCESHEDSNNAASAWASWMMPESPFEKDISLTRPPTCASENSTAATSEAFYCGQQSNRSSLALDPTSLGFPRDDIPFIRKGVSKTSLVALASFASQISFSKPTCWPPRLARIWALRSIFSKIAVVGVFARILLSGACNTLQASSSLFGGPEITFLDVIEVAACVLPLLWVLWATSPPTRPDLALSHTLAYGAPCARVPRLIMYALFVIVVEVYSTLRAGYAVTAASCDAPIWQTVILHCLGVVVVVLRVYVAILGLRLHDELVSAQRRVLPDASADPSDTTFEVAIDCEAPDVSVDGWLGPPSLGDGCEATVSVEADDEASRPKTRCQTVIRKLRRCNKRRLVVYFLLFAAVGVACGVIWFFTHKEKEVTPELPSSCATAQNATATCVQFESIGDRYWQPNQPDSMAGMADTPADCCSGCDGVGDCQAWMFESSTRRCRWIKFKDQPCVADPGDLQCRCFTSPGTIFGFKPISQIVWLRGDV